MIESTLINEYISETYLKKRYSDKYRNETYNLMNSFFNETDIAYDDLTKQDMIDIYEHAAMMSINTFHSCKSRISDFMRWMYETGNGSIKPWEEMREIAFKDMNREGFYEAYYFADLDDLNSAMKASFPDEMCDFSTFRCAALLVWHGISTQALPEILKSDLHDDGTIFDRSTNREIKLFPSIVPYLLDYRDANDFTSKRLGERVFPYKKTEYLFRSDKNAHLTHKQIVYTSINASKAAAKVNRTFQWTRIYDSGIYYRAHEYEKQNGNISRTDYKLLSELFGVRDIDLSDKRKCYNLSQKFDEYQEFKHYKYENN